MSKAMELPAFDRVGRDFFTTLCSEQDFEPLDTPAERHGSWEWTFRKHANHLDRFVVIAFTSLPASVPDAAWYAIAIWAAGEQESRYTRKLISELHASLKPDLQQSVQSTLRAPILRAMTIANSLTPRDLDEVYLRPGAPDSQERRSR